MSATRLEKRSADQPPQIRHEIIGVNTDAGERAFPVTMRVQTLACDLAFRTSFRMVRLPDVKPSAAAGLGRLTGHGFDGTTTQAG